MDRFVQVHAMLFLLVSSVGTLPNQQKGMKEHIPESLLS